MYSNGKRLYCYYLDVFSEQNKDIFMYGHQMFTSSRLIKIGNVLIIAAINSLICQSSAKSIEIQLQPATHNRRIILCLRRRRKKRRRVIKT